MEKIVKKKRKPNKPSWTVVCADLETQMCSGCEKYEHTEPECWLAGYKFLYSDDNLYFFTSIKQMLDDIWDKQKQHKVYNTLIYFHNGARFDDFYIYDTLISKLGFTPILEDDKLEEIKTKDRKHFTFFASNDTNYNISIYYKRHKIKIRDSYQLIPLSIEKLGGKKKGKFNDKEKYSHIYYSSPSEVPLIDQQKLEEDIDTMIHSLRSDLYYGNEEGLKKPLSMTIGSWALKDQKASSSFVRWNLFNKLTLEEWDYYINFYRGGIVWARDDRVGKILTGDIYHYDVNSLFPWVEKDFRLPFNMPLTQKPDYGTYTTCYHIFIVKAILKEEKCPYIGIYDNKYAYETEKERENVDNDNSYSYPNTIYQLHYYVFDFELEWIEKQYDIEYKVIKKTYFMTKDYLKPWVEKYEKLKMDYTIKKDKVNRTIVKLILNSGYGKYGQKRFNMKNYFKKITNEEREKLRVNAKVFKIADQDGYYFFDKKVEEESRIMKLNYVPLAAYITARARVFISEMRQKYYKYFIYGDTDDMYLLNHKMDEEYLDTYQNRIGQFGLFSYDPEEDYWNKMYVHTSKKYMVSRKDKSIIKFAGFTLANVEMTIEEFASLTYIKDAKTTRRFSNGKPVILNIDGILRKKK